MTERRAGPQVLYDAAVDALAIELVAGARHARTVRVSSAVLAHFDPRGRLVELEVHNARALYSPAELAQLASPVEWLTLKEAATASGLAAGTLRWQIRNGRLAATKRGHDWHVSRAALENYLEGRDPRGRVSLTAPPRRRRAAAKA